VATAWVHIQLRDFSEAELMFDEEETKTILQFFFLSDHQAIEAAQITTALRNLAQGLLVAAVDASYAMGWIEQTFRWVTNPGAGMKKALQKLARRAANHWFKHLKRDQLLTDAKIYESVRDQLARNFRSPFLITLQAKTQDLSNNTKMACIYCMAPGGRGKVWG
jgi:hypothetical protein